MSAVFSAAPNARVAKKINSARNSKRDTVADARIKVAEKLRQNKDYFLNSVGKAKIDHVYKQQLDGTYAVCVKYGNRILGGIFKGDNYLINLDAQVLPNVLEQLALAAEAGMFDAQINAVMQANVAARNK
jgi:hypothetical protein